MSAPVASLRNSLSLSGIVDTPTGVAKRPRPSETRPEALILKRWPLRTTRPLFVQPLLALSALTETLIVKKVGELPVDGCVLGVGAEDSGGLERFCDEVVG